MRPHILMRRLNKVYCALYNVFCMRICHFMEPTANMGHRSRNSVETNPPCKGDLIDLCPTSSFAYINGDPADLDFFYRYKGIQYSKCPLRPIPSILPIRILTRNALLLLLFRTTGTLPRLVHLTPLFLWARAVLLPWLLTASYSLMLLDFFYT